MGYWRKGWLNSVVLNSVTVPALGLVLFQGVKSKRDEREIFLVYP